jgi:hypothetical protein
MLFSLHRSAYEAELGAAFDRADFYWSEFYSLLPGVWSNDQCWQAVASAGGASSDSSDVGRLRASFGREVVLDAHYAFHSALAGSEDAPAGRADWHLCHALKALAYCSISADEAKVFGNEAAARARQHLEAGDITAAQVISAVLIDRFRHDPQYQGLQIQVEFKRVINEDDGRPDVRARGVQTAIDRMTTWRELYEDHSGLYDALAVLYLTHAVASANAGSVSEALVDVARAEAANPELNGISEVKQKLTTLMRDLQTQIASIEMKIARNPNASLNEEGQRLQADARRGFEPAAQWARSEECRALIAGRTRGQTRTIWREIGLPIGSWSLARGTALLNALGQVLESQSADTAGVAREWCLAASRYDLADFDAGVVTAWLERRLGRDDPAAGWVFPAVTLARVEKKTGAEPISDWLTSRSGRRARWQLAIVAVLAAIAAGIFALETYRDRVRGGAWEVMQQANSPDAVADAAERFFTVAHPKSEPSDREHAVWAAYSESIVRILAAAGGQPAPAAAARVERFLEIAQRNSQLAPSEE